MNGARIKLILAGVLVLCIVLGVTCVKKTGPYGPKHLPEWTEYGEFLVDSIELYKANKGSYPDNFPIKPDLKRLPGCREAAYIRLNNEDGTEFFRITLYIHLREAVIYDSRHNLSEKDSWGTHKILDNWMWTKD